MAAQLPLRDVHLPAAPAWWPPAPGWWWVFAVLAVLLLALLIVWVLRRRRRQRWLVLFDQQLAIAADAPARLAAASELLRRAARRVDAHALQLQSDEWLRFLDGRRGSECTAGDGRLLLEGGFRPYVDDAEATRACQLARQRFLELMAGRR